MKAIMISIKPKYVADILNHKKTIEVRKSMPKCDFPIDVYIYCTKDSKQRLYPVALLDKSNQVFKRAYREDKIDNRTNYLNGKVVAKFTLNKVEEILYDHDEREEWYATTTLNDKELEKQSCLSYEELDNYLKGKGYAIHISDLEIFDKPKELSEFKRYHEKKDEHSPCWTCKRFGTGCMSCSLTKAPQSYMFIETEDN